MRKRQYFLFFLIICLMITGMTWYLFFREPEREHISIVFSEKTQFKVGDDIDPLSLIQSSSSTKIIYPEIDTSTPGEKDLLYIAIGDTGIQKEFMNTITVISPEPPILKLKQDSLTLNVGESFDAIAMVEECRDIYDGLLSAEISGVYDLNVPGTYQIHYAVTNSSDISAEAEFSLHIKEIEKPVTNVPVTGTDPSPLAEQEKPKDEPVVKPPASSYQGKTTWMFADGYDFNRAKDACMQAAQTVTGRYTCDVIYDPASGIAIGYRLIY